MPLVRLSLIKGKSRDYVRAIGDGVHRALIEAYSIPPDDRFQLIQHHEPDDLIYDADYLGIHRTDDVVFINIVASRGRTTAQKQTLFRLIADNLRHDPGVRPEDVLVVMSPNEREDWSFGNGLASYVKGDGTV
jgi:phenylpyruvate tautomerase PptA (4-oxalocrotonate tautomerase family)